MFLEGFFSFRFILYSDIQKQKLFTNFQIFCCHCKNLSLDLHIIQYTLTTMANLSRQSKKTNQSRKIQVAKNKYKNLKNEKINKIN